MCNLDRDYRELDQIRLKQVIHSNNKIRAENAITNAIKNRFVPLFSALVG